MIDALAPLALLVALAGCLTSCAASVTAASSTATPTATAIPPTATRALPTATILAGSQWIPLASTSPADLVAAARDTLPRTFEGGDSFDITAASPAGTPAVVWELRNSEFSQSTDLIVVPFQQGGGYVDVMLALNSTHTGFRPAEEFAGGVLPHGEIWKYTSAQAISALSAQRHVAKAAGFVPILVYWTVNFSDVQSGAVTWDVSSLGPKNPVWMLRGANGVYYILANNERIYALSEMPLHTLPPTGY
jgi:hypothetical protein